VGGSAPAAAPVGSTTWAPRLPVDRGYAPALREEATRRGSVARVVRAVGWTLVVAGSVVLLYVVYLLWFTNLGTDRAQRELAETWDLTVPSQLAAPDEGPDGEEPVEPEEPELVELGEAYAAIWFERDGELIVSDEVLYVVEGVTLDLLRRGPGHYPDSDVPGGSGNLAIAGHRTTYGAPFWALDELTDGDTIHVVDRRGEEWVYAYREQRIVAPTDTWVVDEDPLETGLPTITLTTCHPKFSAAQRLIAWGELVGEPRASGEPGDAGDEDAGADTDREDALPGE
jgi:sortase A